jgi:hypothetical protein
LPRRPSAGASSSSNIAASASCGNTRTIATTDGSVRRNTARYINHSCKPNAVPYDVGGKIHIYARKNIQPGEEITYDYGKEYFDIFLKPIGCKCAACTPEPKRGKKAAGRKRN